MVINERHYMSLPGFHKDRSWDRYSLLHYFIKTSIIPILKNRYGDTSDKNNYRPIAIATVMSSYLI